MCQCADTTQVKRRLPICVQLSVRVVRLAFIVALTSKASPPTQHQLCRIIFSVNCSQSHKVKYHPVADVQHVEDCAAVVSCATVQYPPHVEPWADNVIPSSLTRLVNERLRGWGGPLRHHRRVAAVGAWPLGAGWAGAASRRRALACRGVGSVSAVLQVVSV